MMKKRVGLSVVLAAMALSFSLAQTTLRLAHISDTEHPAQHGALRFKELVEEGTSGRIRIEVYPNSTLGSAPEYTEQIGLCAIDLGLSTSGQLQVYVPEYAVVMMPFIYDGYEHAHRALDGAAGDALADLAAEQGFVVLANWEWGFRQITNSRRPIESSADIQGLKMRVPNEIQLMAMFEALGASTETIAFPELYMALAQGVVDGQDNPIPTIYHQKFFEVQSYVALTNHVYNTQMLVMSPCAWDALSDADREVVLDAAAAAGQLVRQLTLEDEDQLVAAMEAAGVTVTRPNPAEFRDAVAPAINRIAAFAGEDFTEEFLRLVDEAR
jgi:TRAP-type transport system periplasmic protein